MPKRSPLINFIVKKFNIIGWFIGLVTSAVGPSLTAPLGSDLPYGLGAFIFAVLGFVAFYNLFQTAGPVAKVAISGALAVLTVAGFTIYQRMLHNPDYGTPSFWIDVAELAVFCVSYFFLLGLIAFVYKHGGRFIIDRLFPAGP